MVISEALGFDMPDGALDPRALEEELLRPIPKARRVQWEISWREWRPGETGGPAYVRKTLDRLDRDELDELARWVLDRLAREAEGPLTAARLLARWNGEAKSA